MRISGSFHTSPIFAPVVLIVPTVCTPQIFARRFVASSSSSSLLLPVLIIVPTSTGSLAKLPTFCPSSWLIPANCRTTRGTPKGQYIAHDIYFVAPLGDVSRNNKSEAGKQDDDKTSRRGDKTGGTQICIVCDIVGRYYFVSKLYWMILFWYYFGITFCQPSAARYIVCDTKRWIRLVLWMSAGVTSLLPVLNLDKDEDQDNNQDDKKRLQNVQLFI